MNKKPANGKSPIRPRARIMRTLGDELISNDITAVLELVKNSYDADATSVLVRIVNKKGKRNGLIEIIDNGHGMSLNTVKSTWMEPATIYKKRKTKSEKLKRRVLGNKGIGRFAASRLGDNLEMISKRMSMANEVVAEFNWAQFDDEKLFLDQIEVNWSLREPKDISRNGSISKLWDEDPELKPTTKDLLQGTVLRITNLREVWSKEQVRKLRTSLARLVAPVNLSEKKDGEEKKFKVFLLDPFFEEMDYQSEVNPIELLKNPPYIVEGNIDEDGKYNLKITMRGYKDAIIREGVFVNSEKNSFLCGPFSIELKIWDRDKDALSYLLGESGSTLKSVRDTLDLYSGISIYRDGFRVLPYGESFNDWVRLDIRSRLNPTLRLANNQIIGNVIISSDKNPYLQDQSNREGIMEGAALNDLRFLIILVLSEVEKIRYKNRRTKDIEKNKDNLKEETKISSLFDGLNFNLVNDYIDSKHSGDAELISIVRKQEDSLLKRVNDYKEVLARYRRLSTLGQLIDVVLHEGRHPIAKIKNSADMGGIKAQRQNVDTKDLVRLFDNINKQAERIITVFDRMEPLGGQRKGIHTKRIFVGETIKDSFEMMNFLIEAEGIEVDISDSQVELIADPTEINEIFVNLISNSIYWLKQTPRKERKILVIINKLKVVAEAEGVEIIFSDNGPGVDEEYRELIFDPYFSGKPEGQGVGLGLTIAGEIVSDYYHGKLELIDDGPYEGASFRITIIGREK